VYYKIAVGFLSTSQMPAKDRSENLLDYFYFLGSWSEILVTEKLS